MKLKRTVLLVTFVVTMGLLLAASAALAEPIVILDGDTATGIQNLDVGGTPYNVAFLFTTATDLYGDPPANFDFTDQSSAHQAKMAVIAALNGEPNATTAGPSAAEGQDVFAIGFDFQDPSMQAQLGAYIDRITLHVWVDADFRLVDPDLKRIYADFTPAGPAPDPVTVGGSVRGLVGSGLVREFPGRP